MFADSDIARDILRKRYYADGESSPGILLDRVAGFIASNEIEFERWYSEFYDVMYTGQFLPNSPCLVNAGRGGGLFACFVIGMDDSLESISSAKTQAMAITKSGGGWGIGLSNLRPEGAKVHGSTHGIAGGPIGFLGTFSSDMRVMTQGGFRDAACMATLHVNHPDIKRFIDAKSPINSITELLSLRKLDADPQQLATVLLGNDIISAAAETYLSNFNMSVLITNGFMDAARNAMSYPLTFGGVEYGRINAAELLHSIALSAWENGEPGVLFIDTIRKRTKYDPASIIATNPCGEQPLPPYGSCCLGSINLSEFVAGNGSLDVAGIEETTRIATRFLDNMIDLNKFPTQETENWSKFNRSIGIGVMGFADMLVKMGIRYDSKDAIGIASTVASAIRATAEDESRNLLIEKGGDPDLFDGRRNNAVMSIAPTGTISLLTGCSPGIEPIFRDKIVRKDETGTHEINHPLADRDAFITVDDLRWESIVDIVAEFSKSVDTSVSYTVNLPEAATVDDVINVYTYAWTKGCNGCTVYRNNSRKRQVLNDVQATSSTKRKRPQVLGGATYKYTGRVENRSTNLYVTVNDSSDGKPYEIFVNTPHITSLTELQLVTAVTRLTSLAIRYYTPIREIIRQLRKIEGQSPGSIPLLISNVLSEHTKIQEGDCPECGSSVVRQGGCITCESCGYSRCG